MFNLLSMIDITGFVIIGGLISIGISILYIIATWKIFTKAGESGWKSLVPVYSEYVLYKICWKTKFFWIILALSVARAVGLYITKYAIIKGVFGDVIALVCFVMMWVILLFQFFCYHKLAFAFGKGAGFGTLMFLFAPIPTLVLAFGKAEYKGNVYNTKK